MPSNAQKPANSVTETAIPVFAAPNWRGAQLAPPQVAQLPKGRIAISVNPVLLYASRSQVLPHHQLPQGKYQVSKRLFPVSPYNAPCQMPRELKPAKTRARLIQVRILLRKAEAQQFLAAPLAKERRTGHRRDPGLGQQKPCFFRRHFPR